MNVFKQPGLWDFPDITKIVNPYKKSKHRKAREIKAKSRVKKRKNKQT